MIQLIPAAIDHATWLDAVSIASIGVITFFLKQTWNIMQETRKKVERHEVKIGVLENQGEQHSVEIIRLRDRASGGSP